jgi:hypothetical protein
MGAGDSEDMVKFCFDAWAPGTNIEYSYHIVSPNKNIFGCVGLKNKEYCILNKQYTKEEYEALIPKIKQHMMDMPYVDKLSRVYKYGEFFPSELSLFAYSESLANSYFPLSKEEAEKNGFRWKEIENTRTIADRCNVTFELGKNHLPKFDVPEGETDMSYLRTLCEEGLQDRYGGSEHFQEAKERLDFELSTIERMGFAAYFLIVSDYINWAKDHGVIVGPGRGSAAGSVVAYSLKITNHK